MSDEISANLKKEKYIQDFCANGKGNTGFREIKFCKYSRAPSAASVW